MRLHLGSPICRPKKYTVCQTCLGAVGRTGDHGHRHGAIKTGLAPPRKKDRQTQRAAEHRAAKLFLNSAQGSQDSDMTHSTGLRPEDWR